MTGTVIEIRENGFGFIRNPDERHKIFFHRSNLRDGLEFSDDLLQRKVSFTLEHGEKGLRAVGVELT